MAALWVAKTKEEQQPYQVCWLCSSATALFACHQVPHVPLWLAQEQAAEDRRRTQRLGNAAGLGPVRPPVTCSRAACRACVRCVLTGSAQVQAYPAPRARCQFPSVPRPGSAPSYCISHGSPNHRQPCVMFQTAGGKLRNPTACARFAEAAADGCVSVAPSESATFIVEMAATLF